MVNCVVCEAEAKVYCEADKAFLCAECDKKVHSSNPLAARHTRFPCCELCKNAASAVYCCNDKAYLCDLCDSAVHSDNPLAARHTIVPAAQALATQAQDANSESDAQSEVHAGCEKAVKKEQQQQQAAPQQEEQVAAAQNFDAETCSPSTGSEAVVPVMDLPSPTVEPVSDDKDAAPKSMFGKEFDFLDLDNGWLDRLETGFDFSDILADDAGLVPTFNAEEAAAAEEQLGAVPQMDEDDEDDELKPCSSDISLDFVAPSIHVPFDGPPAMTSAMQMPCFPQPGMPAGSLLHTVYPAIQASPYYPNPSSFPVVTKDQATRNRELCLERYREKRKNRKFEKTIRYASRKAYAEVRPRIKGRFARKDELEAWARGEGPLAEMGLVYEGQQF